MKGQIGEYKVVKVDWFAILIMLLGIFISVLSSLINADLMFVGGTLFGIGIMRFLE